MADSDIVVSALATAAGISYNALTYATDDPHEGGLLNQSLDVVEIWASQTNNRTAATKVAEGNKTNALHVALGNGETWYYWIKARNKQGYYGEWYPLSSTAGIEGITAVISASESGVPSAWTAYTPTIAASLGAFTSVSATGRYFKIGKLLFIRVKITITTNGTAAGYISVSFPAGYVTAGNENCFGVGIREADEKTLIPGTAVAGASGFVLQDVNGLYPGVDGAVLHAAIWVETST